jgi:hypothetical protein
MHGGGNRGSRWYQVSPFTLKGQPEKFLEQQSIKDKGVECYQLNGWLDESVIDV